MKVQFFITSDNMHLFSLLFSLLLPIPCTMLFTIASFLQELVVGESMVGVACCGENVTADILSGLKEILSLSFYSRFKHISSCALTIVCSLIIVT